MPAVHVGTLLAGGLRHVADECIYEMEHVKHGIDDASVCCICDSNNGDDAGVAVALYGGTLPPTSYTVMCGEKILVELACRLLPIQYLCICVDSTCTKKNGRDLSSPYASYHLVI